MRAHSTYSWADAPWKRALDRIALAWIIAAPVLALALTGADTMAVPATDGAVVTSLGREAPLGSGPLDLARSPGPRR